ncbi:MAG: hypothetical protein HC897_16700, partial [Thermoanaerobaculia bacterium]|nr:hypothetical protein [Thermoanaerobaculia bacterium]
MQPRSLMILSGLVLALGAFIFFYERELPSTDEKAKLEKKVLQLEQGEVSGVEISWGADQVRLEKKEEKDSRDSKDSKDKEAEEAKKPAAEWRLVEPFSARADSALVEGLVSALAELEKQRTLENVEPAAVGLD